MTIGDIIGYFSVDSGSFCDNYRPHAERNIHYLAGIPSMNPTAKRQKMFVLTSNLGILRKIADGIVGGGSNGKSRPIILGSASRNGKQMTIKSTALLFLLPFLFLSGTVCSAQATQPSAIFDQVLAQYQSMSVYSAEGTITADIDTGNIKTTLNTTFTIKMKKPNQYLITWSQVNQMMPTFVQSGAVWSDGSQPYLYMGVMKAYSKMSNDQMALSAATGISGGAAFTIPSLFLPVFSNQRDPFSRLINPQIDGSEQIDGEDCTIISGSSAISKKETFWISKSAHLIRKYSRSMEAPAGGMKVPQMTDQQLDDSIKAMGEQVTDATRQQMRDMMKKAQESVENTHLSGSSTEIQVKIASPDLKGGDFAFQVPPDATLKDSLFGTVPQPPTSGL
jgi:hypothetical protein